jgi:hypothetical protein
MSGPLSSADTAIARAQPNADKGSRSNADWTPQFSLYIYYRLDPEPTSDNGEAKISDRLIRCERLVPQKGIYRLTFEWAKNGVA